VQLFLQWASARGGRRTEAAAVDADLVEYLNMLFLGGHAPPRGEKLLAGLVEVKG